MTDEYEDIEEPSVMSGMMDGLKYYIDNGMVSRAEWAMFARGGTAYLNKTYSTGDKEYIELEEGCMAYKRILDSGITAQEALEFVAKEYSKTPEWIEEVKESYYKHAAEVVVTHDNHPTQKKMLKSGAMDKKALKASKTANSQLRRLHNQVKLQGTLDDLLTAKEELKEEVKDLSAKVMVTGDDLEDVIAQLHLRVRPLGEKAYILKQANYTQQQIAKALGVSINTAKRAYLKYAKGLLVQPPVATNEPK